MERWRVLISAVVVVLCCVSYAYASWPPGDRVLIDIKVTVLYQDGMVAANEPVQTVEMMGAPIVTSQERTDVNGRIRFRGVYCLPMVVVVRGGSFLVDEFHPEEEVTIIAKIDGDPIERGYGKVDPDAAKSVNEWRKTCRR